MIEPRVSVCVCVCLSVRMCVSSLKPIRMSRFWWNFPQMIWRIFASDVFHEFWKFKMDDVMAAILYFFIPALSRLQFCFDFLKNLTQGIKLSSGVCYWTAFSKEIQNGRQKYFFWNRTSKVSISTNSDPLITNLMIFCWFD